MLVETKCLFCGESEDKVLYREKLDEKSFTSFAYSARRKRERQHYKIVRCKKCSLVRSSPIISEEEINSLYKESKFIFSEEEKFVANTYSDLLKELIKKYQLRINSLIEVGCSNGFFLNKALALGIKDVTGFEPSRDCLNFASSEIKSRIINDIFKPELVGNRKFDLACSFHVFDHLRNPKDALKSFKPILNKNGYVLIVCHDVESWSAKIFGDFSPIFDVEHIYLFSKKTMSKLFEDTGFKVLEAGALTNTYPLGYWLRMLAGVNKCVDFIPDFIKNIPVTIKPGNLYVLGKLGD